MAEAAPGFIQPAAAEYKQKDNMQSSKTTAYIQLLKYWLIAPLLSKESAISKKESAKKIPHNFCGG